jgi:hypothetical protein
VEFLFGSHTLDIGPQGRNQQSSGDDQEIEGSLPKLPCVQAVVVECRRSGALLRRRKRYFYLYSDYRLDYGDPRTTARYSHGAAYNSALSHPENEDSNGALPPMRVARTNSQIATEVPKESLIVSRTGRG